MAAPREIFLHVGYPKAASTWLQTRIFTADHGFQAPWATHDNAAIERFALTNPVRFNPAETRREFDRAAAPTPGDLIISHEALAGDPVRGQYWGFEAAERLALAFPEARVLLCVRNQADYAYSAWSEYVVRGGVLGLDEYLGSGSVPAGYRPLCPSEFLLFDELAQRFASLFGEERLLVFPIEALSAETTRAMEALSDFLKRRLHASLAQDRVYAGPKGGTQRFLRWANRHFCPYDPTQRRDRSQVTAMASRIERRLPAFLHAKAKAADKAKAASILKGRFGASNRSLQSMTSFDLSALGYEF